MSETFNPSKLVPRGSLGLKMLLVCFLVLLMGIPLILVGALVEERHGRAQQVTNQIGARAGGEQVVGGPMLVVPYQRTQTSVGEDGQVRSVVTRGNYAIFAETGTATATLSTEDRSLGIYKATIYSSDTSFTAEFRPQQALEGVDASYRFDWSGAEIVMFVRDSRAIRDAAEVTFSGGRTATLEPRSTLAIAAPVSTATDSFERPVQYVEPSNLQAFGAPAGFTEAPAEFSVQTRLVVGGAQRFALAAFAQDTTASITGNRTDTSVGGYFQSAYTVIDGREPEAGPSSGAPTAPEGGFIATWRVPYVARAVERSADLASFNLGTAAQRDMAVSFVGADNVYQGVGRAVRYAIMFIGIVFLATLIFEALSGKKAHPAQYILVGLAQCVFYLLLLAITEIIGFSAAFVVATAATVILLAYYAGTSANSVSVGVTSLVGLSALYGVMYVLMTIEDFAFFAGSVVAFLVIASAMITTRRINWYGTPTSTESDNAPAPA